MNNYSMGLLPRSRKIGSLDSRLALEAISVGLLLVIVGIIV